MTVCCTLWPHSPYRVSQNYNRYACEPFCSCKRQLSWISPGSALALQYTTENLSDGQFLIHCWNSRPPSQLFRSPIVQRSGEISNKMPSWHSYASYDLKKYSHVTCRGEQSPSKFDTYSCQVKSKFGWEADLNTLTACQLKSTFGTKRLTARGVFKCVHMCECRSCKC